MPFLVLSFTSIYPCTRSWFSHPHSEFNRAGPQLGPFRSGQVTFPNHSHEDPGHPRLSLPAEVPSGEAIRFGCPEFFRTVGAGARVGHHGKREFSCLWFFTATCIQSWWRGTLGRRGRRPGGSGRRRPSAVGTGRHAGLGRAGCGADPPPGFSPPPMSDPAPQAYPGLHPAPCAPLPENAFFVDHVRTSFLLNLPAASSPGIFWTLLGPRPHLPCVRSVASPADWGTTNSPSRGT